MSDYCCKIEKVKNGFSVEMQDPEIIKSNRAPKKGDSLGVWKDPEVEYVFKTVEEVLAFLKKALPKAVVGDEYSSSFDECCAKAEED